MDMYNSHLRGPARKMAIFDAEMANQANKLATMYEMVSLKSNQIYKDIETRVYLEGGDMDDMTYLYQEAQEEAVAKKKSIIGKLIEWFKKVFDAIREKIGGLIHGNGEDVDVEVPGTLPKIVEALKKHFESIKMALNKIKSGDFVGGVKDLGKAVLPELAFVGTAIVVVKHKAIIGWIKDLTGISKKSEEVVDGVEKAVDKEESEGSLDEADKSLNLFQKFIQKINEVISKLAELASKGLAKAKDLAKSAGAGLKSVPGKLKNRFGKKSATDAEEGETGTEADDVEESVYDFLDDDDFSYFY